MRLSGIERSRKKKVTRAPQMTARHKITQFMNMKHRQAPGRTSVHTVKSILSSVTGDGHKAVEVYGQYKENLLNS